MSDMESSKVVTRFAPSPTGFMHIGSIRTALFAYLWARKNGGTFILRIEDTDKEREVEGSIAHIQESLRWLGIDWDYGPDKTAPFGSCIQSERLDTYRAAARELLAKGFAYPDPYTHEEIEAFKREAEAQKRPFLIREHRPETFTQWDGRSPLRFKVPEIKRWKWHDEVRGDLEAGEEAVDDFILMKGDGYPTYNFAHIIDDHLMDVNYIVRGDEFISSTPRFLSLYDALGITPPRFVTLPPILRADKTKKLGKRDGAKDILEYRTEGYLPDAMINFLALIGWNPGTEQEIFDRRGLVAAFELSRIQTHGALFNEEKLQWLNREYVLKMSDTEFIGYISAPLKDALASRGITVVENAIAKLVPVIRERITVSADVTEMAADGEFDYYFKDPSIDAARLPAKNESSDDVRRHLSHVREQFEGIDEAVAGNPELIKAALWDYATEQGRGNVLWPLRYALTGRDKSPDPFVVASILGREAVMRRIDAVLQSL
jgi:glutamyl-tRNA synthetase